MEKIIKFNTAIGSLNMGDYIINESIDKELKTIYEKNFVVNYPTHTPVATFYQCSKKNDLMKYCNSAKLKFVAGTNLLSNDMIKRWQNWNVNIFNYKPYKNSILVGCGLGGKFTKANLYTKILYKKVLSKDYIHSTRDEKAKLFLEAMGFKAINTGCPTLWSLTKELCNDIPQNKTSKVIFTLTDYCKNPEKDQQLINILNNNYKELYFWIQGSGDFDYIHTFKNIDKIKIVYSLGEYDELLNNGDIDYVGTRLHAGIFAMQHKVRSIIIAIDNRTRDMKETYHLITVERDEIENLDTLINSSFKTDINLDEDKIKTWKQQFIEE